MLAGAVIIPAAPLLVAGVSRHLPPALERVRRAVAAALTAARPAAAVSPPAARPPSIAVLLTAGVGAVHAAPVASLAGVGRPDLQREIPGSGCAPSVAAAVGLELDELPSLPLGLATLALQLPASLPQLPVSVPPDASYPELAEIGRAAVRAVGARRVVVVAAGDLSAGLTLRSPRWEIPGAASWDEQAVAVVDSGRLDGLARLGPGEARRVAASGWAPMAALSGALRDARVGMVVRHYSAPRGVGYLVAAGG